LKSASIVVKINQKIVVLGTGGTIAGTAASSADHTDYTAAQIGVAQLLGGIKGLNEVLRGTSHPTELVTEQVAQIDSKDMDFATMARLAARCAHHLAQSDVCAVLVTHGTDTLEETAWFLHLVLPADLLAAKPVVMTCAMRPATSSQSDGPRNLLDAVQVALDAQACGALVVCAGDVHSAVQVQKVHSHALNAFSSAYEDGAQPLGRLNMPGSAHQACQQPAVHWNAPAKAFLLSNKPVVQVFNTQAAMQLIAHTTSWPRVEIVHNYAGATGAVVRALLADSAVPVQGIVAAGTGNGTLSADLEATLVSAQRRGVHVLRASRCTWGGVSTTAHDTLPCTALSAVKARVQMVLDLALKLATPQELSARVKN
jgi:L-asparaginase